MVRIPFSQVVRLYDQSELTERQLFSSLYSMLPSAKWYLSQGGLSLQAAAYTVIACFLGGVIGIQAISRLMHHFIPSHVVDCDHSHTEDQSDNPGQGAHSLENSTTSQPNGYANEQSPLLSHDDKLSKPRILRRSHSALGETRQKHDRPNQIAPLTRRPSLQTRVSKLVSGATSSCDGDGQCYGYSDPCGQECFKAISRNPVRASSNTRPPAVSQPRLVRTATAPYSCAEQAPLESFVEQDYLNSPHSSTTHISKTSLAKVTSSCRMQPRNHYQPSVRDVDVESNGRNSLSSISSSHHDHTHQQHHHHVHSNAFLSIGLQTSIAIALHKLPEGFITYATNHANPKLGFAVFMALFIHNITEGFAMALPLYLAIGSRWKAMFWSSLLGGVSQPFGAGVAALWFMVAGTSDQAPGETVYGCMFAITAGIMASVALQLFSESLTLNHNRSLCFTFAFVGMAILGLSFALTAG